MADDFIPDDNSVDFIPDPQSMQNKVENFNGILNKAVRGGIGGLMAGGPSLASMSIASGTEKPEAGLPVGLQIVGNVIGGELGKLAGAPLRGGALGGTIGRGIGETGKQAIQSVLGEGSFNPSEIEKSTATAGAVESAMMPLGYGSNKFFSTFAGKEFKSAVGEVLGGIRKRIAESGIKVPVDKLSGMYRQIADELASKVSIHPDLSKVIYNAADDLERVSQKSGGYIGPEDVRRSEQFLSSELKKLGVFGDQLKKGEFSDVSELISAKEGASDAYKQMANIAGEGRNLEKAKNVYSKYASEYPTKFGKHSIVSAILEGGGIHSILGGKLPQGIGNIIASQAVGSQPVWRSIYEILKAGKAVPALATEGIKDINS